MTKTVSILMALFIIGCSPKEPQPSNTQPSASPIAGTIPSDKNTKYVVFNIGKCEYIECTSSSYSGLYAVLHKGDCKNPIHYYMTVNK